MRDRKGVNNSNYRHGHGVAGKETPTYRSWQAMKARCNNKNVKSYKDYGGRGIKVCERWHNFRNFLEDMGGRPENTTLDRINNDGNYAPENCRWADYVTQANNQRPKGKAKEKYISCHTDGKWQVDIRINGKHHYLGLYRDIKMAIEVRDMGLRALKHVNREGERTKSKIIHSELSGIKNGEVYKGGE